ncbi:MAG: bifunctional hydroxymethylpyrimidine kinase/phosphomethylpyrimidine kinase [Acidimicrobiales bacterium]|nr:bifunctional hydroxymethylpyrimidine kinase/phosphomethylpyrimidine kinase [Acidimicrobiales bacterium]
MVVKDIRSNPDVAMTIGGIDTGGGAGVVVDLRTFFSFGVFGTLCVSAITAQNTFEITGIQSVDEAFLMQQIDTVTKDFKVKAFKSGMLANSSLIQVLENALKSGPLVGIPFICDPVLVASNGTPLSGEASRDAYVSLLPQVTLLTPNIGEAQILSGIEINSIDEMKKAAESLVSLGARSVLIKGGHLKGVRATDIFFDGLEFILFEASWVETSNTHGTGCTLSAAITALVAKGIDLTEAIPMAKTYVHSALNGAKEWKLGLGHGPLDHWQSL